LALSPLWEGHILLGKRLGRIVINIFSGTV
jgi:hypothetical protein